MSDDALPKPAVLDATVFSNFASTDAIWLLTAVLPQPRTVSAVKAELELGIDEGYLFLQRALTAVEKTIPVINLSTSLPADLSRALDRGEAEALYAARSSGGTFVSDDRDARVIADDDGVPVTGSLGVLGRGIVSEDIDIETADGWLDRWQQEFGYYSPVESISELLPNEN